MKLKKKHWQILKYAIQGSAYEYGYELHSYVKGHREESLATLMPLSVEDHRQVNGNAHAKNWSDSNLVPRALKLKAIRFWKQTLSKEDYQYFIETGYAWI